MATFGETLNNRLRYLLGTNKPSAIAEGFLALAEDIDLKMASWWTSTHEARPAPAQANRFLKETDTGSLFHDTGAAWEQIMGLQTVRPETVGAIYTVSTRPGISYKPDTMDPRFVGRPTFVIQEFSEAVATSPFTLSVNGVVIGESASYQDSACSFIVPAGQAWSFTGTEGLPMYALLRPL